MSQTATPCLLRCSLALSSIFAVLVYNPMARCARCGRRWRGHAGSGRHKLGETTLRPRGPHLFPTSRPPPSTPPSLHTSSLPPPSSRYLLRPCRQLQSRREVMACRKERVSPATALSGPREANFNVALAPSRTHGSIILLAMFAHVRPLPPALACGSCICQD